MKLVCFISFPGSSYLVLFIFPLHDFDMILIFVCFKKFYSVNLGLKLVNSSNRGLNFPTSSIRAGSL